MTPGERVKVYAAIEEHLDPDDYDGSRCSTCLLGQVVLALTQRPRDEEIYDAYREGWVNRFGEVLDIDMSGTNAQAYTVIHTIFVAAGEYPYSKKPEKALEMVRNLLGVRSPGWAVPDWPSEAVAEILARVP